jgi:tripartite-type tricarboxylate transporter receptor subunit TctC
MFLWEGAVRKVIAFVAAMLLCLGSGQAATWPSGPVTLIVPYGPGGTSDNVARLAADKLSRSLGQPVIVENKPGASGMIGTAFAARAKPDGYTLLLVNNATLVIQPLVSSSVPYDPQKNLTFIASMLDAQQFIGVSAKFGTADVAAMIEKLKASPGKYNYGSAGSGSFGNFCGEFFKLATGTDMQHVPYKGSGAALLDLMAGRIQVEFDPVVTTQAKNGVNVLAVMSDRRFPGAPDVPTMAELGYPQLVLPGWFGIGGPAGLPADITDKIAAILMAAVKEPDVIERATSWGLQVAPHGPADSAAMLAADLRRYADIRAKAHIDVVQ